MAVDYDLVVVGGTLSAREAALRAVRMGARVALVLHGETTAPHLDLHAQIQPAQRLFQVAEAALLGLIEPPKLDPAGWPAGQQWLVQVGTTVSPLDARFLMAQGIDVIADRGAFVPGKRLTVAIAERHLSTRAVLLATGGLTVAPSIPGLDSFPYLTPETLPKLETLPASMAVLGSTPTALTLSQTLAQWGVRVQLITPAADLLEAEDPDVSHWMAAQLAATGVQVYLSTGLESVRQTGGQIELCRHAQAPIVADALLVATPARPRLSALNLSAVGLKPSDRGLPVSEHLQTRHPRIYGCGAVLGGYSVAAIARYEAEVAVDNALFWNRRRVNYNTLPYHLPMLPALARVGLTEPQARQRYGKAVRVYRRSLYDNLDAHWRGLTTGFCKLIAHRNGQILGGHLIAPDASAAIQSLALAMQRGCTLRDIAHWHTLPQSLTDLLRETAVQGQRDRWQPGQWRRDWAENWFNWRRSRKS